MEAAQIGRDQAVDVREVDERMVIEPVHLGRYNIGSLVRGITDEPTRGGRNWRGGGSGTLVMPAYVPEGGDVVWLQFDPQAGHEQAGHPPAVVLGPTSYNKRAGRIVGCPTTTRIKGNSFKVALAGTPATVVLADQVKSQVWRARKGTVSAAELAGIRPRC